VWAGDLSSEALDVAARNVARHQLGARVHLECGDLLEPLPGEFDIVCANLPYVDEAAALPSEVTAQPASALFAADGGAALVVRLLKEAPAHLAPGGRVLAEIDPAILEVVQEAARGAFAAIDVHRDLGGHERLLEAWS
jgi:HemK-like putative methylase